MQNILQKSDLLIPLFDHDRIILQEIITSQDTLYREQWSYLLKDVLYKMSNYTVHLRGNRINCTLDEVVTFILNLINTKTKAYTLNISEPGISGNYDEETIYHFYYESPEEVMQSIVKTFCHNYRLPPTSVLLTHQLAFVRKCGEYIRTEERNEQSTR